MQTKVADGVPLAAPVALAAEPDDSAAYMHCCVAFTTAECGTCGAGWCEVLTVYCMLVPLFFYIFTCSSASTLCWCSVVAAANEQVTVGHLPTCRCLSCASSIRTKELMKRARRQSKTAQHELRTHMARWGPISHVWRHPAVEQHMTAAAQAISPMLNLILKEGSRPMHLL
jgi:hypothetical protein